MLHHIVKLITMSTKNAEEEEDRNHPVPLFIKATTTTLALEKLSKINFKSAEFTNQKIILIKIKIDDQIDEKLNETSFAHYFNTSSAVLLTIKSEKLAKIFWKTAKSEKFYLLQICDIFGDIELDFCEQFLISEIIDDKNGILSKLQGRRNLNLQDIGNENEQNLLMLASIDNRDDVIAELLKHDFDVDDEDSEEHNAIEKAWMNCTNASNLEIKEKSCKIILSLLKNNSKYPKKFDFKMKNELEVKSYEFSYENCSESVKNFVDYSEKLHILVTESNLEELKLEIVKEPWLCYFYDRNNKSLIAHAIESKDIDVWKFLISLRLSIGQHEIQNLGEFYESYDSDTDDLKDIQLEHTKCARELSSSHVHFLLTCSKIGSNDRRSDERWNLVEEAFRIMDTDKSCSKILKIAAKWKRLTIYFDFKHDTAYYLDPVSSLGTKGVIYGVHMIYIGAKYLPDVKMKHVVISTIIHELCHLAVFLTYINNYDPYPKGESDDKRRFEDEVVPECEENGDFEDIVGTVAYYIQEHHNSEYIVRVVQMLMHYYVLDPTIECENSKILKDRREKFGKLFKYFEEVVERDFNDFLGIIDTLLDEHVDIKYDQLTSPMKTRILHSEINFQGQETTFFELIEIDDEILSQITSEQIRNMLIIGKAIEIGNNPPNTQPVCSIDRKFVQIPKHDPKVITKSQIMFKAHKSKTLVLADNAGAGKTTTFCQITKDLIIDFKIYWVSYIELRNHQETIKSFKLNHNSLTIDQIYQLLLKIQGLKSSLEEEIFKKLFFKNRIIFLLDGFDEISPDFNELFIKMIKKLQENSKFQLWISTRPQHANQLRVALDCQTYEFTPYSWDEKRQLITDILSRIDSFDENTLNEFIKSFEVFFEAVKINTPYGYSINNPLFIKIIVELYIANDIDLKSKNLDLFSIYEKIEKKQRKKFDFKIEFEDRDEFPFQVCHQALALKILYWNMDELKDLRILKKWNEKRKILTAEQIQRYGFVVIPLDFNVQSNYRADFTHRTYVEFFIAKFIVKFAFGSKSHENEEIKCFINLLKKVGDNMNFENIFNFILCYMRRENQILNVKVKEFMLIEFDEIKNQIKFPVEQNNFHSIKFFTLFFINDLDVLKGFWSINEDKIVIFHVINCLGGFAPFNLIEILNLFSFTFGNDWHNVLNKSEKSLTTDQEIEQLNISEEVDKNLLKLFNLCKNYLDFDEKIDFYTKFVFSREALESITKNTVIEILRILSDLFKKNSNFLITALHSLISETNDASVLNYLLDNIEIFLTNDENLLKTVLFRPYWNSSHPLYKSMILKDLNAFKKFINLCGKFENEDFQQIFTFDNLLIQMIPIVSDEIYPDLVSFVKKVFKSNDDSFAKCFEMDQSYNLRDYTKVYLKDKKILEKLENFLLEFYNKNQMKARNLIRKFLGNRNFDIFELATQFTKKRSLDVMKNIVDAIEKYSVPFEPRDYKIIDEFFENIFTNMTHESYPVLKRILVIYLRSIKKEYYEIGLEVRTNSSSIFKQYLSPLISKIVKNEESFYYFQKFVKEYFCYDLDLENIIGSIIYRSNDSLFSHITSDYKNSYKRVINIYLEYIQSDEAIQQHLITTKAFSTIFYIPKETIELFSEFIDKVFSSNQQRLLECFDFSAKSLMHDDNFSKFQEFLFHLFKDDEVKKRLCMRSILFKDNKYYNKSDILDSIFKNREPKELERMLKIYNKYYDSADEMLIILMIDGSGSLIDSLFNAKDDNFETFLNIIVKEFASNKDILEEEIHIFCQQAYRSSENIQKIKKFENFLRKNFNLNLTRKFVRSTLFIKKDCQFNLSLISNAITKNDVEELQLTINLLKDYSESREEIKNYLKSLNIIYSWFCDYMKDEIYQILKEFLIELFASNKEDLLECFDFKDLIYLCTTEEKIKNFDKFLNDFYENDENRKRKVIRQVLFYKNSNIFLTLSSNINSFKNFKLFLFKHKNSFEEIQNLFISSKINILDMISSRNIQNLLINFLNEVFKDNKNLLKDCMHGFFCHEIITQETKFENCIKFLLKLFENDENSVKSCIRSILKIEFEESHHPILIAAKFENVNDFIRVLKIYLKYTNSFEDLQEIIIKSKIFLATFSKVLPENIQNFQVFIKIVFESNKGKLVESMSYSEGCEIILNKKKFELFVKFLSEFLPNELKRDSIRKLLFNDYSLYFHPLTETTKSFIKFSTHSFEDIKNLYLNYSNSLEELQNIFNQKNFLINIMMNLDDTFYTSFAQFLYEIFKNNMDNLHEFMTTDLKYQYFSKIKQLTYIENFLKQANCNENQIEKCIIKILSNEYLTKTHPLVLALRDESDDLKKVFKFYIKHESLQTNLKNVFMTQKILLTIFEEIKLENFDAFLKFIEEIFEFEQPSFCENFKINYNKYDFKELGKKRKGILRDFLINFVFKNDECKIEKVKNYFLLIDIPRLFPNQI